MCPPTTYRIRKRQQIQIPMNSSYDEVMKNSKKQSFYLKDTAILSNMCEICSGIPEFLGRSCKGFTNRN